MRPQPFVFHVAVHCPSFFRGRFIRNLRDKLSEQERSFGEELKRIASAREVFQKVCIRSTVPTGIARVLYVVQYICVCCRNRTITVCALSLLFL